ncbi:transglutaminase family protein [Streptomyces sp. KE1]|uniref:transglutaminase-like domain-containing protein n=1 Tax=Streptomyces sp. KE1 TaxID=1638939 RepID=UPI00063E7089|nr:transglutaminase family protein [Streptomyces sp. KE1]KLI96811.1 transglutaminase [Streptomyces sp. KE1]
MSSTLAQPWNKPAYLQSDEVVDHGSPVVRRLAATLGADRLPAHEYAEAAFTYVRDRIAHSDDTGDPRVTWRASDVLTLATGICHAKAHALCALLWAGGIPAGLCYQRLRRSDEEPATVVHGLIALALPGGDGWHRQDPRGGEPGRAARFSLTAEHLVWPVRPALGEADLPGVHATAHPRVLTALQGARDRTELGGLLPADLADPR